ncbi:hypothetical protein SUGI_0482310 [Cryptomeria japonica]|uniref:uncharacterized protein LOC131064389 n=1 Tax=Cryptomeria japonica TaxID=3369 RepID=UPI002408994D|nr:uncharacterized protein LOC131064389 [Cryptomeria japonica]GLJ25206.1 hypothetical protein SUGI_0482310 [Cryptomeria japonica]
MNSSPLSNLEFPSVDYGELENFAGIRDNCSKNGIPCQHIFHNEGSNPSNKTLQDQLNYANCLLRFLQARTTNIQTSHTLIYPYLERLIAHSNQIPALESRISALDDKLESLPDIEKKLDKIPALRSRIADLEDKLQRFHEIENKLDKVLGKLELLINKPEHPMPTPPKPNDDGVPIEPKPDRYVRSPNLVGRISWTTAN